MFRGDADLSGVSQAEIPDELSVLWTFEGTEQFKSSPVVCQDRVIAASLDGTLYALDLQGKKHWHFKADNGFEAPAIIHDNRVYVGDMDGIMHCLNLYTGDTLWHFQTDGQIMGSPIVYNWKGTNTLLFGSYDYFLYALNPEDGSLLWKYESDNYINGAPACLDGKAVFGGCDGFLHIVNVPDGKLIKKVEVATYVAGSACLEDNMAFIGDYDGRFSAIDLEKETIKWRWEDETKNLAFIASPSLFQDMLVVGCRDKFLYCFDKNDGSLIWKRNTGSRVDASAIISYNRVLVANMRGDVLVCDLKSGKPVQSFEFGAAISATPALIDGKVIIAAEDGNIYCLGGRP